MNISVEQLQAIESGELVEITVERTECVLVRKDVFQKVTSQASDGFDVREMEPLLADLAPEDWEDASNYED